MAAIIAVFRSRTQALDCREMLKKYKIPAAIIATPTHLGCGCGYSVKYSATAQRTVKNIISRAGYTSFYGYAEYR